MSESWQVLKVNDLSGGPEQSVYHLKLVFSILPLNFFESLALSRLNFRVIFSSK